MALVQRLDNLANRRLFAVIHMFGKQRLVKSGDLLMVDQHLPLECGEKLLINKCLVLGGKDFSIIDVKDAITSKTNELNNYEDAVSEAEMKVLEDQGEKLHLQVGDILINLDPEKTQQWLEDKMDALKKSVRELKEKKEKIVEEMSELKTHLYARFGSNIHLES